MSAWQVALSLTAAIAEPPGCGWLIPRIIHRSAPRTRARFFVIWIFSASGGTLGGFLPYHGWMWPAGSAVSLAVALVLWWWRRKRDKVKALLGAKSRALRDALVRRAREAAKPRPVRQPAPYPAR